MSGESIFDEYFEEYEVRSDFSREYISLWPGWLGEDRLHLLDEVKEDEWARFNSLLAAISTDLRVGVAMCSTADVTFPENFEGQLSDYESSRAKDASQFSKFVIPDLNCVVTEEWDFTYILWHRCDGAVEKLSPYILNAKLHHFSD